MTALPRLLVLTDRHQTNGRSLVEVVQAAVAGGATAVVLREKDLHRSERVRIATALRPVVDLLLVASDPSVAGDGVHLAGRERIPDPRPGIVGRSCHDAAEVAAAADAGADYVTLSPVFPTPSKLGYGPGLGIDGLRATVAGATVPVYALGGIDARRAGACLDAGAAGVAVMGGIMRAPDPAAAVAELLRS